jgi:glutathione S-transferase
MDLVLRQVAMALLQGYNEAPKPALAVEAADKPAAQVDKTKEALSLCVIYLRDRIGVPRDMSYPAARQLRAYLNWIIDTALA